MIEDKLENLKKDYVNNVPQDHTIHNNWQQLSSKLDTQKQTAARSIPRSLAVLVLASLAFSGFIATAQAAKPGQKLYSVKILSENVYSKATGDQEFKIGRRAQEVIETSDNGESFDEASKQYQQAINDAKDEAKDAEEDEKEDLRKKLEEQEKRFQQALDQKPKNKSRLEGILERTRRTRGEVKGKKDQESQDQNNNKGKNENNDGKDDDDAEKESRKSDSD